MLNRKGYNSVRSFLYTLVIFFSGLLFIIGCAQTEIVTEPVYTYDGDNVIAPDRAEGEGHFERLIIRGATMIDGSGYPPLGPVDIVVEGNRIEEIHRVGYPGVEINEENRPKGATKEIDAHGMYIMPGFVDLHTHAHTTPAYPQGVTAEYVFKIMLAHGVTTVRDAGANSGLEWTLFERERSKNNEITAPRIYVYSRERHLGVDLRTPEDAREMVRRADEMGVDGLKIGAHDPAIMEAILDEANARNLGTMAHLGQTGVANMNTLDAARLGLGTATHFYGLFESLMDENVIQDWPETHNHSDEYDRFSQVARLWDQIAEPGSEKWNSVIEEMIELNLVLDPTMTIYEAGRDVMRARNADWHDKYTHPNLWDFFQPNREAHGSYWFYWTTHDEVAWKNFYDRWMMFINDFKNAGGRVTTGSDAGYIYTVHGFGYIEELELLQEAGFNPLEVIQSATLNGALTLHEPTGEPVQFGKIREGMLADLVIIEENPLKNLKVLYGTGAIKINEDNEIERVGGVKYTIKDGIIYDAKQLLQDIADMVEEAKNDN